MFGCRVLIFLTGKVTLVDPNQTFFIIIIWLLRIFNLGKRTNAIFADIQTIWEVYTISFLLESGKILRTTFIIKWPLKARLNSTLTDSSLKEGQKMHIYYYKRTNKSLGGKITYCKIGKDFLTFFSCKQKRLIIANIIFSNLKRTFDFFSLQ